MKKIRLFGALIILSGCGDKALETISNITSQETNPLKTSFQIKDTTWNITIPDGWYYVAPPTASTPTVLLAQKQSANLVILQKQGPIPTAKQFLEQSQKDFYTFQATSSDTSNWIFQGQLAIKDTPRVFHQQVSPIPNTNNYLYASCSYETSAVTEKDCENILSSWNSTTLQSE